MLKKIKLKHFRIVKEDVIRKKALFILYTAYDIKINIKAITLKFYDQASTYTGRY